MTRSIPVQAVPAELTADDAAHDECGVLGLSTPHGDGVAQLAFFGLFALQHRGQEAAVRRELKTVGEVGNTVKWP